MARIRFARLVPASETRQQVHELVGKYKVVMWKAQGFFVDELRPGELWITHGREEALARWAELHGVPARALALVGYEEEDDD